MVYSEEHSTLFACACYRFEEKVLGASSKVETPDPIPNSAVKRFRANGSRKARVGQCRELFLQTQRNS